MYQGLGELRFQQKQQEKQIKLENQLLIESATINHCNAQLIYFRERLSLQITPKNKMKYQERIFQLEQKRRKAIAKSELIELELTRI